ncbi:hypothetical protein [Mycobacterium sp.]|uniref:hypothetical protein n=1 Tax=Mycobacterium sp. TaxID=1785 RepID=UPI003A8B9FAE
MIPIVIVTSIIIIAILVIVVFFISKKKKEEKKKEVGEIYSDVKDEIMRFKKHYNKKHEVKNSKIRDRHNQILKERENENAGN